MQFTATVNSSRPKSTSSYCRRWST